ncbi:FliM/FliN family flagellar motor switch protein [Consotaella salsifontis]|uniref:Flagellar motor switch protein FliM n=1 Tax=Consotaella salsifontis TaxID=1365950 RepID=A0A1T4NQJ6_9HYPH|nr:FliM/FliN family flagellar motor switch protein [Consotaella salsifontis]SJZ81463.1 flagellar motor switch protein FliM [Consotaella salsifontis]
MAQPAKDIITSGNIGARLRSASEVEPGRLPRLKMIAEEWAEDALGAMKKLAVNPIELELVSMSTTTFLKSSKDYSQAAIAEVVRSPAWTEAGFILADAMFVELITEAVFGGEGGNREPSNRPLTDLDKNVIHLVLKTINKSATHAFAKLADMPLTLGGHIFDHDIGEALAGVLPAEKTRFVGLSFELRMGGQKSTLRFALPESFLAFHRRKLVSVPEVVTTTPDESWTRKIEVGLGKADMGIRAVLGEKAITLDMVSRFEVGQTIVLDETMQSLIPIECEDQRLFRGRVGRSREFYVVRVEEKVDPTEEFIDDILAR